MIQLVSNVTLIQQRRANHGALLYSQQQVLMLKIRHSNIVRSGYWRIEAETIHRNILSSSREKGL